MHDLYDKTLIEVMKRVDKKKILSHVLEQINDSLKTIPGEVKLHLYTAKGKMTHL